MRLLFDYIIRREPNAVRLNPAGLTVLWLCAALWVVPSYAAGFRELGDQGLRFGVWYPTDAPTKRQRLGPFETEMAKGAPPRPGKYRIILLSHGNGGRYRNHYLTAQALADSGFIIVAPNHQVDHLIGGSQTSAALDYRYLELLRALETVRADSILGPHLSNAPVNGLGYSLGGATILLSAGAGFDTGKIDRYCDENGTEDPEFCDDPGYISRITQSFKFSPKLRPTAESFRHTPIITGSAVLVAPVSQGINVADGLALKALTMIAIEGDQIAKPRFHTEPLRQAASKLLPVHVETVPGHHYAFIAPFPDWLTEVEDIPVAKDPEGFDRPAFLMTINSIIIKIFEENK